MPSHFSRWMRDINERFLLGTSSFGVLDIPLPAGATFVSQILWGSIGWTVGSTLGAAYAAQDRGLGRTILFVGDGSL